MAVIELYTSREMHITKEGTTLTQIFTCSNTDLNAWGDGITALPILGLPWTPAREDLRVTDIRTWWLDNVNCRVEVLYSTQGLAYPRNLPDKLSSVETRFDFSYEPIQLNNADDKYYDFVDKKTVTWASKYKANYDAWAGATGYKAGDIRKNDDDNVNEIYKCILGHTSANANEPGTGDDWPKYWEQVIELPAVPRPGPNIVMTEKMNLSGWDWNTVKDTIGKVNNADWLKQYVTKLNRRKETQIDITGDDTGKWLVTGFTDESVGDTNYETAFIFIYNDEGWNTPYGLTLGIYETADFNKPPLPDDTDDTIDDGGTRTD